ncbi:MAG TPA: class I SAM-dependent methyltransferase [Acetobacteraceae bacterium]|jgi:SAM-dependent methyltransferase|nr:class I SAM-dependent methyltransferase [Acetobacteraceae bacterium]
MTQKAEFDAHADGYDAGMDNKLKALTGGSADDFVAVKVHWLLRRWPELRSNAAWSILDYGCGAATLLRLLRAAGIPGRLTGTDVSSGMLREAARIWPADQPPPGLQIQNGAATGLPSDSFDLALISAVLHHVPVPGRNEVYAELQRVLRPDGRLVVFEHNPWNPITSYVVAHTPIDRGAILLPPPEVTASLTAGGWRDIRTSHLMFLPPRLGLVATAAERMFGWLPIGGQYAVTACK